MIWTLFFAPWAVTCLSKKAGFFLSFFYFYIHYEYKPQLMKAITHHSKKLLQTQLDDSSTCSESIELGQYDYDYNLYAVEGKCEDFEQTEHDVL
jgi:hypothetical protein